MLPSRFPFPVDKVLNGFFNRYPDPMHAPSILGVKELERKTDEASGNVFIKREYSISNLLPSAFRVVFMQDVVWAFLSFTQM